MNVGWKMRPSVERNDAHVMDHLDINCNLVLGLYYPIVAVVGPGSHGRHAGANRHTLFAGRPVFRSVRTAASDLLLLVPGGLGRRRQWWNPAVGRIEDERGSPGLDSLCAKLVENVVVGADAVIDAGFTFGECRFL